MSILTSMASFFSTFIIFSLLFTTNISIVLAMTNPPPSLTVFTVPSGGAEAFAFDLKGRLYTGVNDGRILQYSNETGFVDFAYTAPNRSKARCDGTNDLSLARICGRTLGLSFHIATGLLYATDASYGLCVVGPQGGLATQILTGINDLPFKFLDAIDIDQLTGKIYITDISSELNIEQYLNPNRTGVDSSGRVVEYNPITKNAKLLQNMLRAPTGVAVSIDSSFILFTSYDLNIVTKYWLRGTNANTSQVVTNITIPDNVTRPKLKNYFWVASNIKMDSTVMPMGVKIDENGNILQNLILGEPFYNGTIISEVNEYGGDLYIAAVGANFSGVCKNYDAVSKTIFC